MKKKIGHLFSPDSTTVPVSASKKVRGIFIVSTVSFFGNMPYFQFLKNFFINWIH